jgi:hypothetical protein
MTITATTPPAQAPLAPDGRRTKREFQGLIWLTLRLHRWAALCWVLLLLVTAGTLLWAAGPGVDAAWAGYHTENCRDNGQMSVDCNYGAPALERYETAVTVSSSLISLVPLLVALWAGAALIGRELENGTAQLVWAQSVTPARWLAARLAVPAALLTAGTLLLVLLHRVMWSAHIERGGGPWYWQEYYDKFFVGNGPLAISRVLLGLAVGALTGLLVRRSLPSLGFGFFAMTGLVYALAQLRPYLWPPVTVTTTVEQRGSGRTGLLVDQGGLTSDGTRVPDPCLTSAGCDSVPDLVGHYTDHHPSSHFWPLHLIESGIVLALTALLVRAAFHLLRRRAGGSVTPRRKGGTT